MDFLDVAPLPEVLALSYKLTFQVKASQSHRAESCWRFMEQFLRNLGEGENREVWWGAEAKGKEGEKERRDKKEPN